MEENKDWASGTLKEVPFWRNDMGPLEYEIERAYYTWCYEKRIVQSCKYSPLWKQGKKMDCNMENGIKVIEFAAKMMKMSENELNKHIIKV